MAPLLRVPAGIVKLAVPVTSGCDALKPPLARMTVPVGRACPLAPARVTVTPSVCKFVMLVADGVTVMVAAVVPSGDATFTVAD